MSSLTQEKHLDNYFSNNNDHNYRHKKFKKMASTVSVPPTETAQKNEVKDIENNAVKKNTDTSITNGSIAASHPEIEKIKEIQNNISLDVDKNVQNTFNDNGISVSDINNFDSTSGKTSFLEEFSNKTDNLDNDFTRDVQNGSGGRYVCSYCNLACAKPSVLQKHIRAHTNERPYPCVPCGFAFKTKSNLYKHRRSRSHALRLQGEPGEAGEAGDDDASADDSDVDSASPEPRIDARLYKPKFRAAATAAASNEDVYKHKKIFSPNADFLNEHISKIISDNEAIIDVLETPLQKKYSKIKQIAESKQMQSNENFDTKSDASPLNLTKNVKEEFSFRKRAHSETFNQTDFQKHPLNPEGSIIKDLLLKTKANGLAQASNEIEGVGPLYVCPLCQIPYRSAENLEIHRMYYCKGNTVNLTSGQKEAKIARHDIFVRSNSINVRMPEVQPNHLHKPALSPRNNKPENLVIIKPEYNEVVAPLPSPGPLLGNTRLVDTRSSEFVQKCNSFKTKPTVSPLRRGDNPSSSYSPRLSESISPRPIDAYAHAKILNRCLDPHVTPIRTLEDIQQSQMRQSATSLQMFGGEVKIVDHSGTMTTLRIEPSRNQLSPIVIHQELSPSSMANISEASSIVVGSGLYSGGTIVQTPKDGRTIKSQTPRIMMATTPTVSVQNTNTPHDRSHFQFPPLSAITAFNPLTLPPLSPTSLPNGATSILHAGKVIPHVPGMPGPNTPNIYVDTQNIHTSKVVKNETKTIVPESTKDLKQKNAILNNTTPIATNNNAMLENIRSNRSPNPKLQKGDLDRHHTGPIILPEKKATYVNIPLLKVKTVEEITTLTAKTNMLQSTKQNLRLESVPQKRSADGVPKPPQSKPVIATKSIDKTSAQEIRNFNFENLITKAEIYNNQIISLSEVAHKTGKPSSSGTTLSERSETSYFQKKENSVSGSEDRKAKFLRPSTLPLKPGTFTPKRHHGITPNANTMPLVSPETPRPAKAYGQLHLNGNAYTYLGLKCSTKVFYCTINRPQPTYVPNQHFLSMYSNWQLLSELTDPLGLPASTAMSLYDSRHRPQSTTISRSKQEMILTHSSQSNRGSKDQILSAAESKRTEDKKGEDSAVPKKELAGGFESNEEYTYIRGRGRGRYVCSECGIRCKKPSMLKKHIRTHTDVRPYTCTHCAFSFKTKGNLTKHMKSKAHYKKCCELGINPSEGSDVDGGETAQCSGETDDETDSDGDEGNEGETESSDTEAGKSRLPEHEAAHCLLSLGAGTPGLLTSARPSTYPYSPPPLAAAEPGPAPDNEPMDLSTSEAGAGNAGGEEPRVLASLASNTAALGSAAWRAPSAAGEPMLHAYLTERALLDARIKQSQLAAAPQGDDKLDIVYSQTKQLSVESETRTVALTSSPRVSSETYKNTTIIENADDVPKREPLPDSIVMANMKPSASIDQKKSRNEGIAENVKLVVSEYLKISRVNNPIDKINHQPNDECNKKVNVSNVETEDAKSPDTESIKSSMEHEPVARNVVIGAGGVAFKVSKGKEFENMSTYSPGRLMEDGRRVCDFCNKTFTKPSQLRLHLNIHYIERPYRCSACAVSFRTKGHLQKHERSGSHHNKVSMTSTFGAATSQNPRPFRCSDCNVAFRIHGHLAKHLRSKMHVMKLECLFKLPFGTFTEIERAGVSLTDIDTTDCESSLASLQVLARKLHEKDPSKLEYLEPGTGAGTGGGSALPDSDDDEGALTVDTCDTDIHVRTNEHGDVQKESRVIFSATDN